MREYRVEIAFENYIAQPYWPEMNELIDIQKKSGMNLVRSEEKRENKLNGYLKSHGLSRADYEALLASAARRWYRLDPRDEASEIIIPRHQFAGMLVQAVKSAPAGSRFGTDDLRSRIRVRDFCTGQFGPNAEFRRYVKSDKTNQRRLQVDEVLEDFNAVGLVEFGDDTKLKAVEALLAHALVNVGVGAARKMGYGRGELLSLTPAAAPASAAATASASASASAAATA